MSEADVLSKGSTDRGKRQVGLESMVRHWPTGGAEWPTPSAALTNDGEEPEHWLERKLRHATKDEDATRAGLPLTVAAKAWSTPNARDWKGQDLPGREGGHSLPDQVMRMGGDGSLPSGQTSPRLWSTPSAKAAEDSQTHRSKDRSAELLLTGQAKSLCGVRARLNPRFVEWLMGLPPGWTCVCGGAL